MNENQNLNCMVRGVGRPKKALDSERRFRRDIANNHERKRMQSINDGILALRRILRHKDIDKLSKATVLLRSAEYLIDLETKLRILIEENFRLKYFTKELLQKRLRTSQQLMLASKQKLDKISVKTLNISQQNYNSNDFDDQNKAIDLTLPSN